MDGYFFSWSAVTVFKLVFTASIQRLLLACTPLFDYCTEGNVILITFPEGSSEFSAEGQSVSDLLYSRGRKTCTLTKLISAKDQHSLVRAGDTALLS